MIEYVATRPSCVTISGGICAISSSIGVSPGADPPLKMHIISSAVKIGGLSFVRTWRPDVDPGALGALGVLVALSVLEGGLFPAALSFHADRWLDEFRPHPSATGTTLLG